MVGSNTTCMRSEIDKRAFRNEHQIHFVPLLVSMLVCLLASTASTSSQLRITPAHPICLHSLCECAKRRIYPPANQLSGLRDFMLVGFLAVAPHNN